MAELARAGVNTLPDRPGIAQSWTTDHLTEAAAWNDAAAKHGAYTWLQLRGLALSRARQLEGRRSSAA